MRAPAHVERFLKAVYPEMTELCAASNGERECLTHAAERIEGLVVSLSAAERKLSTAKKLVSWLFQECVAGGYDLDDGIFGGDVQDKLAELEITEERLPEPGSPEAYEWGEDQPLHYLRDEWKEGR